VKDDPHKVAGDFQDNLDSGAYASADTLTQDETIPYPPPLPQFHLLNAVVQSVPASLLSMYTDLAQLDCD